MDIKEPKTASEKIEIYKDEFQDDVLYQEIQRRDLLDELFAPCTLYERVYFGGSYSTKQAAELLDIKGKEQTLINFLNRNEFTRYIKIYRKGKRGYYRYDYKNLFQFKMILMLTELDMSPYDISSLIGTDPEYMVEDTSPFKRFEHSNVPDLGTDKRISKLEDELKKLSSNLNTVMAEYFIISQREQKLIVEKDEGLAKRDLDIWEAEMKSLITQIDGTEKTIKMIEILLSTETERPLYKRIFSSNPINTKELKTELDNWKEKHEELLERKGEMDTQKEVLLSAYKKAQDALEEFSKITINAPTEDEAKEPEDRFKKSYIETKGDLSNDYDETSE